MICGVLAILYLFSTLVPTHQNIIDNNKIRTESRNGATVYVIDRDIDLNGEDLNCKQESILLFNNGRIVNGTIVGNRTKIQGDTQGAIGVSILGTWIIETISDVMFISDFLSDNQIIENINHLQSDDIVQRVLLTRESYHLAISQTGGHALKVSSNTTFFIHSILHLTPNDYRSYNIIDISNKENSRINGGTIIGDVGKHKYIEGTTSEWGNGITITNSSNITIENCTITKCTGDGIYITGNYSESVGDFSSTSKSIILKNVVCDDNRRQGLSIISVDGLFVYNCSFINTGRSESTDPSAGVDIEPNRVRGREKYMSIRNILFERCRMDGNKGYQVSSNKFIVKNGIPNISQIEFRDCHIGGELFVAVDGETFNKCSIESIKLRGGQYPIDNIRFNECQIIGGYGVYLYLSSFTDDRGNRSGGIINNVTLNKCFVSPSIDSLPLRIPGLLSFSGGVGGINRFHCIDCKFSIPRQARKNYLLVKNLNNVYFDGCVISIPGRTLKTIGASFKGCEINAISIDRPSSLKNCIVTYN